MHHLPLLVIALVGCRQAPKAPSVTVTPSAPFTTDDLIAVVDFDGADPDANEIDYLWAWTVNGTATDITTETVPADRTQKGELWEVTATPFIEDDVGESSTASTTVLNTPPVAGITAPPSVGTTVDLVVTPGGEDADGDALTYTYSWTVDGAPASQTGATIPADDTTAGESWEVTAIADDGESSSEPVTATITIGNAQPTITEVVLTPTEVRELDTVVAVVTAEDVDEDPLETTFSWAVNGTELTSITGDTLTGDDFSKGDTIRVTVTVNDGSIDSEAVTSDELTVLNTAPSYASAAIEPGTIVETTTLSCLPEGWADADGDTESFTTEWFVNGSSVSTADTLTGDLFSYLDTIVCAAIPNDGEEAGEPATSAELSVANSIPSVTGAAISPSSPTAADTLTVIDVVSEDLDGHTVTWSVRWLVDGTEVSTTNTLDASLVGKGSVVTAEITGTDGYDSAPVFTTSSVTVLNTLPTVSKPNLNGPAYTNDVLSGSVTSTDIDNDTVSLAYEWLVNGTAVATTATLDGATFFSKGDVVVLKVTPSDDESSGATQQSDPLTISDSLPSASLEDWTDTTVYTNDVLSVTANSSDADGDTVTLSYRWLVNNSEVATSTTLDGATFFSKGDVVVLEVTPTADGTSGTPVTTDPLTILNSAPSAPEISITPEVPAEGLDDLQCVVTAPSVDADGDTISYTAAWRVDDSGFTNTNSTAFTGDTVPGAETMLSEVWECVVTATDGDNGSAVSDSAEVTIKSCGDGILDDGEEVDPPEGPFSTVSGDEGTCRWDFAEVKQLYCNGTCTWAGGSGCDQADADIFCKLRTGNPNSTAVSFEVTTALAEPGFPCPRNGYGSVVDVNNRGLQGITVRYQDTSILANHGAGRVVVNPDCTNP